MCALATQSRCATIIFATFIVRFRPPATANVLDVTRLVVVGNQIQGASQAPHQGGDSHRSSGHGGYGAWEPGRSWGDTRSLLVSGYIVTAAGFAGNGSPEGVVPAEVGSLYTQTRCGNPLLPRLWVKETGTDSRGWKPVITAPPPLPIQCPLRILRPLLTARLPSLLRRISGHVRRTQACTRCVWYARYNPVTQIWGEPRQMTGFLRNDADPFVLHGSDGSLWLFWRRFVGNPGLDRYQLFYRRIFPSI